MPSSRRNLPLNQIPAGAHAANPLPPLPDGEEGSASSAPPELVEKVREVLALIRPAIQEDGGDIELVAVTPEGVVQVRLHGACVGCPSSSVTLQSGIEQNLRDRIVGVTGVVAVA